MDQLLWYLFTGTRGGLNRLRIVELLYDRPYNAHQIAGLTGLDYRTVRHHLSVLTRHHVLANPAPENYGSLYFLGGLTRSQWSTVLEIRRLVVNGRRSSAESASSDRKRPAG